MTDKIAILAGDGIGPEILIEAIKIIDFLKDFGQLDIDYEQALVGGAAYQATGHPLPGETLELCKSADAVILGAVGGPKWDNIERELRPERALLSLRSELELFSNLRPATLYPQLAGASSLKPELVQGLDIMIVRELTGGIYFGEPRGIRTKDNGEREGYNTLIYSESEIERIAHSAFQVAQRRNKRLTSVDKANVLVSTELWREVVIEVGKKYPNITLDHLYVDNATMQLIREPKQFDVIVTTNMFGDILSDAAAMLTGSIGMLPSASLDKNGKGMYEPVHGSAPDIAGENKANPLATILSLAMALRYSLDKPELADAIEKAVGEVLDQGLRTSDIATAQDTLVGTAAMGDAVLNQLHSNLA